MLGSFCSWRFEFDILVLTLIPTFVCKCTAFVCVVVVWAASRGFYINPEKEIKLGYDNEYG